MLDNIKIYRIETGENFESDSFDCGDDDLNEFLLKEASLYRDELLLLVMQWLIVATLKRQLHTSAWPMTGFR